MSLRGQLGNLRGDLFIRRLLSLLQRLLDPVVLGEVNLADLADLADTAPTADATEATERAGE